MSIICLSYQYAVVFNNWKHIWFYNLIKQFEEFASISWLLMQTYWTIAVLVYGMLAFVWNWIVILNKVVHSNWNKPLLDHSCILHVLLHSHRNRYMYYIKTRINVLELCTYKKKLDMPDEGSNIRRNGGNYPINSRFKDELTIGWISFYINIARFQIS